MRICIDLRTGTGCQADNPNDATRCRRCGKPLRYALQLHDPGALVGDYHIIGVIGCGAFGAVYRAQVARMPSVKVALKESFNAQSMRSFARELDLLRNLSHPNLPRYFDVFEAEECSYLVMELVPGQSLEQVLQRQRGPLPEPQVLGYAVQLCDVLSYLHGQRPQILHRDIKPANIRVTPAGLIKLVDFGLLKHGEDSTRDSRRGLTPAYAPPEQWGDGSGTTPQSDLYSLGATLYHLLAGRKAPSATERIAAGSDSLPPLRDLSPSISAHVAGAIRTAMELRQEQRFADAAQMRSALIEPQRGGTGALRQPPPQQLRLRQTLTGHTSFVWSVRWSPDGKLIASGGSDQTVRLWDATDGRLVRMLELRGFMNSANAVTFSPDGELIAAGGSDGKIWIWHVSDGSSAAVLQGHTDAINSVMFSPDGRVLASASNDATVRLWRVSDGRQLRAFHGHTQAVHTAAWSPDGALIASAGGSPIAPLDRAILIWGGEDGQIVQRLEGHTGNINSVVWSPDGALLASSGGDRTVRVWRLQDGGQCATLTAADLRGAGGTVAFSPDAQTIASGHWDNTVRLWRTSDGQLVNTLQEHTDFVKSVAWSPDGRTLASGGDDRTIRLWQI